MYVNQCTPDANREKSEFGFKKRKEEKDKKRNFKKEGKKIPRPRVLLTPLSLPLLRYA